MYDLSEITDVTAIGYKGTIGDIKRMFSMAKEYGESIKRICVPTNLVSYARYNSDAIVSAVVGFPFGTATEDEVHKAIIDGAHEIDIPVSISLLELCMNNKAEFKFTDWELPLIKCPDIRYKIILHTDYIEGIIGSNEFELQNMIELVCKSVLRNIREAGIRKYMLKTCTGYGPGKASIKTVRIMSTFVDVKASGGIRTIQQAHDLIDAGANLLGIGYESYFNIMKEKNNENRD